MLHLDGVTRVLCLSLLCSLILVPQILTLVLGKRRAPPAAAKTQRSQTPLLTAAALNHMNKERG